MTRSFAAFAYAGLLVFSLPSVASACSCRQPSLASVSANSDVVISGTVVQVRRVGRTQSGRVYATIRVGKVYKGRVPKLMTVETRGSSAACGVGFAVGQTVRFGANQGERNYMTGLCSQF
jgi:hypothetical protein